ncbi:MAG TPA: glycosyltransferase family 4 protein [Candidatus Polarisedimenticolia bacterium]|nr:glycosyltransferase family 4 protein [Candidatus Polarisedimenticolia bacterium]
MPPASQFVVATPGRSVYDDNARVLEKTGRLRFIALGTRNGATGIPSDHTRLYPTFGLANFIAAKALSPYRAESVRFGMLPWFDRWVKKQLTPGDHIISSYGYANECFKWVRANGGKTFIDAGNSHVDHYWELISEEHRRWKCSLPPFSPAWLRRSRETLPETDFVLSPSSYVTNSFLARGFRPEQILKNIYPVDLSLFKPDGKPRPANRPLTLINTGSLSLRKGTPYLLEAFRLVRTRIPNARLLLTRIIQEDVKPILAQYADLPIEWSPALPHAKLAERLQNADLFILPSLEDGWGRTVSEAMACGLPAILTPNTGASDSVQPGVSGEIVPIRDPQAIADAILKWAEIITRRDYIPSVLFDKELLSFQHFESCFVKQLEDLEH